MINDVFKLLLRTIKSKAIQSIDINGKQTVGVALIIALLVANLISSQWCQPFKLALPSGG